MDHRLDILFLEDDPVLVEWVGLQLSAADIDARIDHVEDRAGFSARLEHGYDLYLLDYHLPDFDGLQALALAQGRWPETPKIIVSGTLDEESIIETLRSGATDYVLKSNMRRLIPAIRRALGDNTNTHRRRQAESELDDSRARFDDIAENIPGGVYQYVRRPDGSHYLPYVSPGFEQLLGVSQSEVLEDADKAFASLLPGDRERFLDSLAHSARELSPWKQEFRVVRGDARPIWLQGRAKPHRQADGSVLWNGIMLDISREKQVAAELEYQRVLFESAFREVPNAMLMTSPERTILMCNPSALEIFGYKAEELIGKSTELLYPDSNTYQRVGEKRESAHLRDSAESITVEFKRRDGELFTGETIGTPIFDKSGQVVAFVSVVRDISERVQADAEKEGLRQELENLVVARTRELQASEEQLRTTLDTVVDAIITIDAQGRIVMYNNAAETMFGYSPEETHGRNINMLMPEPYAGEHDDYLRNYLNTGSARILGIGREVTGRRKDGRTFPMDLAVSEMRINGERMFTGVVRDISERKQAREALRASENRLQFLVQQSPAVIYTCRADGDYAPTFVSQNISDLMGFEPEQFIGDFDFWAANIHPEDAPEVYRKRQSVFAKGRMFCEYRFRMPNGEYHWLHDELRLIRDENDEPREIIGYWIDIDDKKRAERELLEGGERLRRSQIYANIGTWEWNIRDGKMVWSERVGPLFGYASGEFAANYEEYLETIYAEDRAKVIEAVNACVELGAEFDIEHRVLMPDGGIRWMLERGDVVRDRDGAPSRMLGVVQDITTRKEFEERLKEAQRIGQIGHWSWDIRGSSGEVLWSEEIYRIFGLRPGAVKPTPLRFMRFVHPDDRRGLKRYVRLVFAGRGQTGIDHRIHTHDGSERWIHVEVVVQADDSGRPLSLSGTLQDITERKNAETDLVRAKETAEKASKAKSEFLSNMSHELRTPLNAILGFSQLLRIDGGLDDEQDDSLAMIEQAGNHLLSLINEVLDLARIESGRMELEIDDVELDELLADCHTLIAPLAASHGVNLELADGHEFVVRGDRTRVKQVLLNLLSNAIKYNHQNGSVTLRCEDTRQGNLRISVTDTGPGIESARLSELFSAFNRLGKERGQVEGTGIGLVIAKNLIELMGGDIGVDSVPGMGSTFWINIPLSTAARKIKSGGQQADESRGLRRDADGGRHSILYIEDNPANLRLVGHLFKKRGNVTLITSETPGEGMRLARECQPDLILLDINLPDMDGYEVLSHLRADPLTRDIPVLAVSANAMPSDLKRGHSAGFDDYITKPIDVKKFLAAIDSVFKQVEARRRSAPAA